MAIDYTEIAAGALESLLEAGQTVKLRRTVPGEYDPSTGGAVDVDVDYEGTGAAFDYSLQDSGQASDPNTLIRVGDKQLYLAVTQTNGDAMPTPLTSDRMVIGAAVWSVQNVKEVNPAGVPVLYELNLRK